LKYEIKIGIAGALAGAITGLFGAGGGMVLVPLLTAVSELKESEVFPTSVSVILPICIVSLAICSGSTGLPFKEALPYLIGSTIGGLLAGFTGHKFPVKWLHKSLGLLILWGGIRYLC
jgi:uncharacterized membrane protein YfcA